MVFIIFFDSILILITSFTLLLEPVVSLTNPIPSNLLTPTSILRDLLSQSFQSKTAIAVPGVHDALSAKVFAQHETPILFLSGFGVSAARLGQPDAGILSLSEMEDTTRNVVAVTSEPQLPYKNRRIPLIVDGDTGYGGSANVRRTVRNLAKAGAAAITIEDQLFPKKCTYAAGENIKVVTEEEASARIKTALAARDEARYIDGNDMLIVARTDCRAALGMDEVVKRCQVFEDLGADIVYAENLQSRDEYILLRQKLLPTTPMMIAQLHIGDENIEQTLYSMKDIGEMGYNLALFGVTALQATVATLQSVAKEFEQAEIYFDMYNKEQQTSNFAQLSSFSDVKYVVGFPELDKFSKENPCV